MKARVNSVRREMDHEPSRAVLVKRANALRAAAVAAEKAIASVAGDQGKATFARVRLLKMALAKQAVLLKQVERKLSRWGRAT